MPMPTGYNEAVAKTYGDFPRLTIGGHKCRIHQVVISSSSNGNKMLTVEFETTIEDSQPNFYASSEKKAIHKVIVDDRLRDRNGTAYGVANLKQVITSIEDSNPGFKVNWDNYGVNDVIWCQQFRGKLVGMVLYEEEWKDKYGNVRVSIKPKYCCDYAKALEQTAPKRKTIQPEPTYTQQTLAPGAAGQEGFYSMPDNLDDASLPFN